jgi:hypothetical protein
VLDGVVEILGTRIQERCGPGLTSVGNADCRVELAVEKGTRREGFRIEDTSDGVRILGTDNRGILRGGKFLRGNSYHRGSFTLGNCRGTSVPDKPLQGVCTVPIFSNFCHVAGVLTA